MGMDEFAIIRALTSQNRSFSPAGWDRVVVGVGDDAAVGKLTEGFDVVMSCDVMVETIHFLPRTMKDRDVGYKALASNVSDMAAMGAIPRFALVSLSFPKDYSLSKLEEMYRGLYECASDYGVAVVGGDTTASPQFLTLSVSIIGEVEKGKALLRSGAKEGDAVFVTGFPGCSAAGLDWLLKQNEDVGKVAVPEPYAPLVASHQRPSPNVEAGRMLLSSGGCHALNDISDGLSSEAWEIAEASEKGLILDESLIPIHPALARYAEETGKDPLEWVFSGGEDYILLGTMDPNMVKVMKDQFSARGWPFAVIGEVTGDFTGVKLRNAKGQLIELEKKGYNHFSS